MLWRRRRRLLAMAQFILSLGFIPGFALLVWSVSDGPAVLSALGIPSTLPAVTYSDAGFSVGLLGFCFGALRISRVIYDLRSRAIQGDADAIPPAKPLAPENTAPLAAPITLVWRRTLRSRSKLTVGFFLSLAAYVGLAVLLTWAGLFDFLASLPGWEFWTLVGVVAVAGLGLALIPLAFLHAALRGPRGVLADSVGVRVWCGRKSIAWADARLLEVAARTNRGAGMQTYTLFARDGSSLRWWSRPDDPRYTYSHTLLHSDVNDSEQRAAAIVTLAAAHAGLRPCTLDGLSNEHTSKIAAPGAVHIHSVRFLSLGSLNMLLLLGWTCGCGVATLAFHSPLTPALAPVGAVLVAFSTLWSLFLAVYDELRLPSLLSRELRTSMWLARGVAQSGPAQLWQARNRLRNWPMATRAALLALASAAGLAVMVSALAAGSTGEDAFVAWSSLIWLALTMLFMGWRVIGQFDHDRVRLLADAAGVRRLHAPSESPTPWADIVSLRFTWSRADGFSYTATTRDNDEFTWASQSRRWRDEAPDATTGIAAAAVDGDAFAAIVAARTGLTPAQELT